MPSAPPMAPAVQTAIWQRDRRGGGGTLVPTPPLVPELAALCGAPEAFARSYLRERLRTPLSSVVDVPVVHEGAQLVCHGPPAGWPAGVAQRVQDGGLRLGVLRVRVSARDAERSERLASLSAAAPPPVATRRLAAGRLKAGVHADRGGLDHMEDASVIETTADHGFFCVYDGHGGCDAAHFCRDRLHHNIMASPAFRGGDVGAALLDGFAKTEHDLLHEQRQALAHGGGEDRCGCCGSTALVMLLRADAVHLAWLGDCRAVLSRGGRAVELTTDHSLAAEGEGAERARVLREGGRIEGGRLGGFLEVARAFGDLDLATGAKPLGLSCTPELAARRLTDEDEFVLLGSDGLWGVVDSAAAVQLARSELQAYGDATMASEKLVEAALRRGADDNVTAMVVLLRPIEPEATRTRPKLSLTKAASVPASLHAQGHTPKPPPLSPALSRAALGSNLGQAG